MTDLPVWGIDLTAACLRAVKLALTPEGRPRVEAWDVIDFADDIDDVYSARRFEAASRAVRKFLRHQDVSEAKVVISLRGETAFNRSVTVRQIEDQNLDELLGYEAQQQIPYPLDEVYWDRRVTAIKDGGEVQATIYAVRKKFVDDRLRKFHRLELPVDGLQLRPIALQNFCSAEKLLEDGTAVVDLDYSGMHVLMHHDDQTWFRCLPLGAAELVERVQKKLRVDHRTALSLAMGQSPAPAKQAPALEQLREEFVAEVVGEVARVLGTYAETHRRGRPSGFVLFECHGAAPALAKALKAEFGVTVFKPKGFHAIEVAPDVVTAGVQEHFSGLARASGLALQGLGKADSAVRLYPESMPRSFSPGRVGYVLSACVLLAMTLSGYAARAKLREEFATAAAELKGAHDRLSLKKKDLIETQKLVDDPVKPALDRWVRRAEGRLGALPWYESLLAALAAPPGGARKEATAPILAAFEWGSIEGRVLRPGAARLVLARLENAPVDRLEADLDAFVQSLVGKNGLKSAKATGESWSAAQPTARPPVAPESRALRAKFRHRSYDLTWEGGS